MDKWQGMGVVTGGAAAALAGLLFVAVTLRIDVIAAARDLRSPAAQTLALFVTSLVVAIVLVIPDQTERTAGIELFVVALASAAALLVLNRGAKQVTAPSALGSLLEAVSPTAVSVVLIGVGGVLAAVGWDPGLYFLVPGIVAALVGGVVNAWLFLLKIPATPAN
ncbi:hypothetical protein EV644_1074 [Kribbella orskensis]|uniref:Modulator of FtsH protease n=1 Tax=Kribbella orskensis TaxID=2512216 RepID=A0ABY2BJ80_9ACTN|nr:MULTISPECIES: hypothetical protein [Kribbella]TCN39036.1 hypothetical protein EV642_1074 [Kribbella sp. VKM Ac-2500]TCO21683.1 hypothetical protein EV644_1074 [Kribbella orskensis]